MKKLLKLSSLCLISMFQLFSVASSCEEGNIPNKGELIVKSKRVLSTVICDKTLIELPNDILNEVSNHINLSDLHSLESTCKKLNNNLKEAPLYVFLTQGDKSSKSSREKFINPLPITSLKICEFMLEDNIFQKEQIEYRPYEVNHVKVRNTLNSLSNNSSIKLEVMYYIAYMDYKGLGGPTNYLSAKENFYILSKHSQTPHNLKKKAEDYLIKILFCNRTY